ncbi:MAG TPA: MBL fold metallo-hydrolase [Acidobacteriota bacterium]|nr:MBL fold metallo-hydrolase [Acidobacteriota bacterium]
MNKSLLVLMAVAAGFGLIGMTLQKLEDDVFPTPGGELKIFFVGHASLFLTFGGKVIHVDPVGSEGDYARLPKADIILVTHEHFDHLDTEAIKDIGKAGTQVVVSPACVGKLKDAVVMKNGERRTFQGFEIEAVPAYNIAHKRPDGNPFHPQGQGNGYVLTIGGKRIYFAGDTEPVPEMAALKDIDIAFLPMNLPYTMSPEMTAEAARTIRPKFLYPYHFGDTDMGRLQKLLKGEPGIEVRVRPMS